MFGFVTKKIYVQNIPIGLIIKGNTDRKPKIQHTMRMLKCGKILLYSI